MKIICFHQSADLYGSDRSFLQVIEYLKDSQRFSKITVVLPRIGPLSNLLISLDVEVIFMDLSLLSKTYLKSFQWGKILFPLIAFSKKKKLIEEYDILYVNTSVILDFYVLAPFLKLKKILHIREIPANWLGKVLSTFISKSDALVIFNSFSTQNSFAKFENGMVIHNAFEGYSYSESENNSSLSITEKPLNILLIGRINSWKGQDFVIEALSRIPDKNFKLRIVGSPAPGNEDLVIKLKGTVDKFELNDKIKFIEFASDPSDEYRNADLVIVPSIKPEPFGRIAIEAMSLGKPVVASNSGGLPEIIEHEISGFLFEPGSIDSFNNYVQKYINDRNLLVAHGIASRKLFLEKFSIDKMHRQLDKVFTAFNSFNPKFNETV